MNDPLHSSKYSLRHAKRHIDTLDGGINAFFATSPYAQVVDIDPNSGDDIYKIKLIKPMPEELSGIAFDAVNALRSALDQAAFAIGIAAGTNGKKSHFPFGDSLDNVQSLRAKGRGSCNIPEDMFDLMIAFKPYKGGDNALWAVNALCNSHKHEVILPMAFSTGGPTHLRSGRVENATSHIFPPRWDSAKNEMILVTVKHGSAVKMDIQFTSFIAIAKTEVVGLQEATPFLRAVLGKVESIVLGIEAQGRRLKYFL